MIVGVGSGFVSLGYFFMFFIDIVGIVWEVILNVGVVFMGVVVWE